MFSVKYNLVTLRWYATLILALCIFLPLATTTDPDFKKFDHFIAVVDFYHVLKYALTNEFGYLFWIHDGTRLMLLFTWPLVFLMLEKRCSNRWVKYLVIMIEVLFAAITLLYLLIYLTLLIQFGSFHIGSVCAIAAFMAYVVLSLITAVKAVGKKRQVAKAK